jgi:hypothetical protein
MPSLEGIRDRIDVSYGFENALPAAKALIGRGLLSCSHFDGSRSPVELLGKAISDVVRKASTFGGNDAFSMEIRLSDYLEEGQSRGNCLFFVWGNTDHPQYIPLRPMFEQLAGSPYQERLMASLYHWLHRAAWQVFHGFGFCEAESIYGWRKESYAEARESGEDVDLEGEVEYADPSRVVRYIRDSAKLKLKPHELELAISSISRPDLRDAFRKAHRIFVQSRKIKLPASSRECQDFIEDAAYYMDADPLPGLCVSHWRDDPIVAWLDNYCEDQFNSGVSCRAPIIRCFRPDDTESFLQIISALPRMVDTVLRLSDWVRLAGEMEDECNDRDRRSTQVCTDQGGPDL